MNAIFITVRTASTRLPKKCLLYISGKRSIERVIERVKRSKKADIIVLCTTTLPEDEALCEIARRKGIEFFRGSSEDKLMRWLGAAKKYDVDFFITADGDDLLCDPELIDLAFSQSNGVDFIQSNDVPCGAFTYGIRTSALRKVCAIKNSNETEMMVPYFTETNLFNVQSLKNIPDDLKRPEIRMTLDYEDDLKFFRNIFTYFESKQFGLRDVIQYLNENPEVIKINSYLTEKWAENQKSKTNMVLRESV